MSKRAYISRYLLILKKLKAKPYSTYDELQIFLENQFDYLQMQDDNLNIGLSKRTFQRDVQEIRNIFGIDIEYSTKNKGYFISQDEMENMNFQRMIDAFNMFNSLNLSQDLSPFIYLEKRKPQGTENLYGLIHAIKNKVQIKFSYHKFWEDEITERIAEPYALKECKSRWYVLSKDCKDDLVKTFALDRLANLEISSTRFKFPEILNIEENFRYCFGIINPTDAEPQEIILSFDTLKGKYIKTLPLHETQEILIDNDDELRVKLKVFITEDFIIELLSYGDKLKVVSPQTLVDEIKTVFQNAFKQYQNQIYPD